MLHVTGSVLHMMLFREAVLFATDKKAVEAFSTSKQEKDFTRKRTAFCRPNTTGIWNMTQEIDDATRIAAERMATGRLGFRIFKRTFDIAFSLLILVAFSWLFALVGLAIKIDDPNGPVIFRQMRVGQNGQVFQMYKFRSMRVDAEDRLAQLIDRNEKTGPVFKIHDDPRVTRVGRVIRKVSIDELPQFINVLKGDLSVVGPRPALPREVAEYTPRQRQRLLIKQGLTCYWQIQPNRDDVSFDEWIDLDLRYIRECSCRVDMQIIARTVTAMACGRGH